jgi:hypothetical protein
MKNSMFIDTIIISKEKLGKVIKHSIYYGMVMTEEQKSKLKEEINSYIDRINKPLDMDEIKKILSEE